MKAGFLPIVGRELRVAARRRGTYVARCAAAAAVFVIGAWFYLIMPYAPPATISQGLFSILSGAALLYAFVSGAHFTANSISEEKRDGTLGLLFLTDLKGYDVVLGKLAATSLGAFYGMLAMLPMIAVPLLIGGVNFTEVLRMSLLSINTMFMSLTAGLFISSMTRSPRQSSGLTFLLLCGLAVIVPLLGSWWFNATSQRLVQHWWLLASPGYAFTYAFENLHRAHPNRYWICMGVLHTLGWAYLAGASLIAPRSWRDKPIGASTSLRERFAAWNYGTGETRAALRRKLLSVNPFFWLASRSRSKPAQVWIVLAVCATLWLWGYVENKRDWLNEGLFIATALVLNTLIKGWFAAECARQISEDRHKGALELILSTPISVREIVRGQSLALQRQFLAPSLFILILYVVFMISTANMVHNDKERGLFMWMWSMGIVVFVLDLCAMFWAGIFFALKAKRPNQASTAAAFLVLAVPWILFAGSMILVVRRGTAEGVLFLWSLTQLAASVATLFILRGIVLDGFRSMAIGRRRAKT
jgi:ABC-type Na+ efflux pump permease subunit